MALAQLASTALRVGHEGRSFESTTEEGDVHSGTRAMKTRGEVRSPPLLHMERESQQPRFRCRLRCVPPHDNGRSENLEEDTSTAVTRTSPMRDGSTDPRD